jgi:hypothetical protein
MCSPEYQSYETLQGKKNFQNNSGNATYNVHNLYHIIVTIYIGILKAVRNTVV